MRRLAGVEDEEKWLAEGIAGIQHNAFFMHRALDANNLREVLKYSALMLSELRTSKLSPQKYYDLYMRAFDQLRQLEVFFKDESRHGLPVVDLYELVQHAGNILPRMYLLCTVGSVYMKSKQAPSKDVLKDLVEMCRGVQHPIRGLFLRSYLAQVSRDKLPEIGSEYEGDANTVMDAVEFVLQNFTEMNKLWVRIQHQGPGTVREKQEKERNELRDLVGKNLHVLGQIEGVDLEMYKETVLPRVLEQVVNCKDELAQYYLMECIIQVFPDEYHLQTLETLLAACTQLMVEITSQPTVDTKIVLTQLMDRLSNYAASSPDVLHEFLQVEAFAKLSNAIGKVIETQIEMPIIGAMTLFVSLLTFTLRVHPDRLDYVDQILGACVVKLSSVPKLEDARAMKQVVALLSAPLEKYNDIVTALTLSNYPRVMDHLDDGTNKVMAMLIIQSIMKNNSCISTADKVEVLFELIKGLIKDLDGTDTEELDEEDFQEEQNSVARLIHTLDNEEPEEMLKYSARLLKKPDQCRAVYACSHLFWVDDIDGIKDGERHLLFHYSHTSLSSQQMANATRGSSGPVTLFVEILNKYIYFYEKGNPHITPSDIQSLIELINTEMQSDDNGNRRTHSDPFFTSTLRYIRFQKQKGGLMGDKYDLIKL
ncbi:hypothetical protein DY000_02064021 [Brassica cretica]|uniref:Vacuolar protein sorting-associated protein 35 n=1 Tax=Brassica cretica TaxID=69181 RepID=A0ABQ7APW5_BRACR|nr:hypothetical protein DY000_02064021 [Brassica cretica]